MLRKRQTMLELLKSNKCCTNHSIRKATVRKLQRAGYSNDKIASITSHKSEQTLRYYAETDMIEYKQICHTLSASGQPSALQNNTNSSTPTSYHEIQQFETQPHQHTPSVIAQ